MTEQQIKMFTSSDAEARLDVSLEKKPVWLSQSNTSSMTAG